MREIKFRGKLVFCEKWVYGGYSSNINAKLHYIVDVKGQPERVIDSTIGQYTGLRDKNGNEIYEGDIVMWGHIDEPMARENPIRKAVVKFSPSLCFETFTKTEFGCPHEFHYGNFSYKETHKYIEIIGNIHDNPELLEEGK
jgi:uncharacterized phage protein (TIGR01671 family)